MQCRPILRTFAESKAVWVVTQIANEAAMRVLQDESDLCANILTVTYAETNTVAAVNTDTAAVNRVRALLTQSVMDAIEQDTSLSVSIPAGTLSGVHWLSGFGPLVTFPISYTATVLSDVSSQLMEVAINQSKYGILIHFHLSMCVVTPGGTSTVSTSVRFPMAETVLLGEIPDNLTEVFGDDQSLTGQIFDYGTTQ